MALEPMAAFFERRKDGYDEHMLRDVEGCDAGYRELAARVPVEARTLLDLGCGTGLELAPIFERLPDVAVTGVDLARGMLDELARKYAGKPITLVCGSYFDVPLGEGAFDAALSVQSLHHFPAAQKIELYRRVCRSLRPGGVFLECDYMARDDDVERALRDENKRLRAEQGIPVGAFYHFDTPMTPAHECELLRQGGFIQADAVWRVGNTTLVVARRG